MNTFIRNSKLSKFIIVFSLLSMFNAVNVTGVYAFGSWVDNAISGGMTTYNGGGGYYHSQGQDIYTLGYSRVRFGTEPGSVSLFTIAPPTLSMGCSGIDAMWGGFSMISGAELQKIMQNIISVAIPFAFNMALGVLCKQCEAIMNQIESIANKLNGLNFNSCRSMEQASNLATQTLNGMMNSNQSSGQTNNWMSGISSALTGNSNGTGTTGILGTINGYVTQVNNVMSGCIPSATAYKQYGNNATCGSIAADNKFEFGSYLRRAAAHAHLGLIQGTQPNSGGFDGILGVIRGSLTGDLVGFLPSNGNGELIY
ncbi:MAG: conjugal transfer protein TraH [bacterium]